MNAIWNVNKLIDWFDSDLREIINLFDKWLKI